MSITWIEDMGVVVVWYWYAFQKIISEFFTDREYEISSESE